jgi:hypothetical protein
MPSTWQQSNIHAAALYLREHIAAGANDPRARAIYEGLLDVLDPPRRTTRRQREAKIATIGVERRSLSDRRTGRARRQAALGAPGGEERRRLLDRRNGKDRRRRG